MSLEDDIRAVRSFMGERRMPEIENFEEAMRVCEAAAEVAVLRRRIDDLEQFLVGAAMQFKALSGRK